MGRAEEVDDIGPARPAETLEAAYRHHADELVAFATGLVGGDAAADVVAGAVTRIVAAGRWSAVRQPRAYLYRAVYHEAVSLRRQRGRRERLGERLRAVPGRGQLPPPDVPADATLVAAVRGLPLRQRAVIVLTYWQDLTPDEVARRLGISPGAVKKHLARGRENVRRALS